MRNFGPRVIKAVKLLPGALRRWGLIGTCGRIWSTWRSGGRLALLEKLRHVAEMEVAALAGSSVAIESPAKSHWGQHSDRVKSRSVPLLDPKVFLELDSGFGVDCARWNAFLTQRVAPSADQKGMFAPTIWFLVNNDRGLSETDITLRSIEEAGHAKRNVRVASYTDSFSSALGSLLASADATDFIWFAQAGDLIDGSAAQLVTQVAIQGADLGLFDTYFVEGDRAFPQLHPGFNAICGLNCNYFRSRFIARAASVRRLFDNLLPIDPYSTARAMIAAHLDGKDIVAIHLAHTPMRISDSRAGMESESRDLMAAERTLDFGAGPPDWGKVGDRRVSIIICTRDKGHLLRQLVRNIFDTGGGLVQEVLIVKHATSSPYALKTLADLSHDRRVRILTYEGPFNFSRQCNSAAKCASAPYLLFLNDDITPVVADWLPQLLLPFQNSEVGVTGPLLLYPDESVQHAGMFLGFMNTAGHTLRAAQLHSGDYLFMTQAPREVSCLTGAALAIDRSLFNDLNGFDPLLGFSLQDADLGLRVNRLGRRVVFNPYSILLHMESISFLNNVRSPANQAILARESVYFRRRWGDPVTPDPFHNPNFYLNAEDLRTLLVHPRSMEMVSGRST